MEIETQWIPMPDGKRLAARIWIPESAAAQPVPAILEYIPYRRRDGSRDRDDQTYGFYAAHGYAGVRLDLRGSGDSEGVTVDEYLPQELDDAVAAIAWIAAQPWCNGAVGMMGISWGGFNALQVAALRPPALKAIVTMCSTDDRYGDDMHYMGGCQLTGNVEWGSTFFSIMAIAPDPLVVGDGWRELWRERLEAVTPMLITSLEHQRRDAWWRHGSVCEDIAAIRCPVLAVGGWSDGYTNAVFRLLRDLKSPRLGIIGPWGHKYPNLGVPGPAIGFLTETLRWWDQWLKGVDTGILREPVLRAWINDWVAPASHHDLVPGRWVGERAWPSAAVGLRQLYLNAAGLEPTAVPGAPLTVSSPQTTGAAGGEWCAYSLGGLGPELPPDQRQDDAHSLVFDGAPLALPLEILGAPVLQLALDCDSPAMNLVVRLGDVAPDGQVARVSYAVLNLAHRDGHSEPRALEPQRRYEVRVQLNDAGYRFAAGHRIRVAISTSYWPMIWPAPTRGVLRILPGLCRLGLPERPLRADEPVVAFPPPEAAAPVPRRVLRPGDAYRRITCDVGSGVQIITVLRDDGRSLREDTGVETGFHKTLRYRIHPSDPLSARADADYEITHRRATGWDTRIRTHSALTCTATDYVVEADLEAFEDDRRVFSRSWTRRVPRDFT